MKVKQKTQLSLYKTQKDVLWLTCGAVCCYCKEGMNKSTYLSPSHNITRTRSTALQMTKEAFSIFHSRHSAHNELALGCVDCLTGKGGVGGVGGWVEGA